jgi:hypothetical protein
LPPDQRPAELEGVELDSFHYGEWLLAQGYDFKVDREETPLFWDYSRFQNRAIKHYFAELADYARAYAAGQGRSILVSGNFFNLIAHWYYPMEPKVDLIITEMRNTRYRQPAWYRYVAGFAGEKPVVVVENPYGGVIPELIELLKAGKGYDLFRMSLYEAAALGANMSVPYGSWMGSTIQDSFYAPHELCVEIQSFLASNVGLFSWKSYSETAVIYSVESNFLLATGRGLFADNRYNLSTSEVGPFWQVCETLSNLSQPYDVVFFPDGDLRQDTLLDKDLAGYRTLILPDCRFLTQAQARLLESFLEGGGCLVVLGDLGGNLPEESRRALLEHASTTWNPEPEGFDPSLLPFGLQVSLSTQTDIAINIQKVPSGAAVHLLRYDFDRTLDRLPDLPELELELRLPAQFGNVDVYSPAGELFASLQVSGQVHRLSLQDLPLYSILLLHGG